jgi:hypothetical protein
MKKAGAISTVVTVILLAVAIMAEAAAGAADC